MSLTIRTEADFTAWTIAQARRAGWIVAHFRPARTASGSWSTPVQGDGKGYPDLTAAHPHRRPLFVELKMPGKKPTREQARWLDTLAATEAADVAVWYPTELEAIRTWLAVLELPLPGRWQHERGRT